MVLSDNPEALHLKTVLSIWSLYLVSVVWGSRLPKESALARILVPDYARVIGWYSF
jgi:hypothetical protein